MAANNTTSANTDANTVLLFAQTRTCADAAKQIIMALFPTGVIKTKYYEAPIDLVDVCAPGFDVSSMKNS